VGSGWFSSLSEILLVYHQWRTLGIIGNPLSYPFFSGVGVLPHKAMASTIPFILFALFQMKFAVITPALITGSFAERVRFISYLLFMVLFSLFIYTPLCHMVWHPDGLLNKYFGVKILQEALLYT
jgi:Amt family ammonium transporter